MADERPVLVDVCCRAGGASAGYARAGWRVVGVDARPQPRYPFDFVEADALEFLAADPPWASAYHISPPCPAYSDATPPDRRGVHVALIPDVRAAATATGKPWVIENIARRRTGLRPDLIYCGCMFGLDPLRRVRWFETSWHAFELRPPCAHSGLAVTVLTHGARAERTVNGVTEKWHVPNDQAARLMGIDWMTSNELGDAIPPAYTERIGALMLAELAEREAV